MIGVLRKPVLYPHRTGIVPGKGEWHRIHFTVQVQKIITAEPNGKGRIVKRILLHPEIRGDLPGSGWNDLHDPPGIGPGTRLWVEKAFLPHHGKAQRYDHSLILDRERIAHRIHEFVQFQGECRDALFPRGFFDRQAVENGLFVRTMLSAEPGQKQRKPVAIEGAPPNLADPIEGCRFAPRCPEVRGKCRKNKQEIRIVAERQVRCDYAK